MQIMQQNAYSYFEHNPNATFEDFEQHFGKAEDISEDEIKDLEDSVQKLTDQNVAKIDAAVETKSKEILTV